jgi:hypothetical protein
MKFKSLRSLIDLSYFQCQKVQRINCPCSDIIHFRSFGVYIIDKIRRIFFSGLKICKPADFPALNFNAEKISRIFAIRRKQQPLTVIPPSVVCKIFMVTVAKIGCQLPYTDP